MDTVPGYTLARLDAIQTTLRQIVANQEQELLLLQALPAAAPATESPSLLSRLERLLPSLQQLGSMAVKNATAILLVWQVLKGGDVFLAAEQLLKLL